MSYDRQARNRMFYNNLYKQYLNYTKKVSDQKQKNRLLKNTNIELSKKLAQLRLEVRKSSAKNASLKAEIYDVAIERKRILEKNKKIFDQLTSFHNEVADIGKKLCDILGSRTCAFRHEIPSSFSMPIVNGQLIQNPRVNEMKPENNYQRFNFKDCIYIQDLSPILEENAEVKKLAKPPDITRRLGHRAKVPQPFTSTGHLDTNVSTVEERGGGENLPCTSVAIPSEVQNVRSGNQSSAIEVGIANASVPAEQLSSTSEYNDLNNTSVARSIDDPLSTNGPEMEDEEVTFPGRGKEKDFSPSIFVNVFPRRKKINDSTCRLSVEDIDLEPDGDNSQELNSICNEKEESSFKQNFSHSSKGCMGVSVNEAQTVLASDHNSTVNFEDTTKSNSGLDSSAKQSIIDESCSNSQKNVEATPTEMRRQSKRNSGVPANSPKNILESPKSCLKSLRGKKVDVSSVSQRNSIRNSVQSPKKSSSDQRSSTSLFAKEETKRALRHKKELNFTESPLIIDKKRIKKKKRNC